ncbi:MAG: PqqD family protein [Acidobacteriota bacterium]
MSVRLRRDVRFRVVGDEAIVIRQRAAEVLVLNEVGARILQLLEGEPNLDELVDSLAQEFEAERSQLQADAVAFVAELVEAGVLEEVSP